MAEDARIRNSYAGYSLRQRWESYPEDQSALEGEVLGQDSPAELWGVSDGAQSPEASACARATHGRPLPEEKHAVCFRDRCRSLEAGGLPGGAICFGGHAGLWHALRALVKSYEYCA